MTLFINKCNNSNACHLQVLFKMDNDGHGQEIQLRNLAANTPLSLCNWKNSMVSEHVTDLYVYLMSEHMYPAKLIVRMSYSSLHDMFFPLLDCRWECSLSGVDRLCSRVALAYRVNVKSTDPPMPQDRGCLEKLLESSMCCTMTVPGPLFTGGLRLYHRFHQGPGDCNCTQARRQPSEP